MMFGSKTYTLEQSQLIPLGRPAVFAFFADAFNLEVLTPPFLRFQIMTPAPIDIQVGTIIEYRISLFGIPMYWKTCIERFEPDELFVDNQEKGPYRLWHHTHTFEEVSGGTLMRDVVRYRLPFGFLGRIAHFIFVRRTLQKIFQFRRDALYGALEVEAPDG